MKTALIAAGALIATTLTGLPDASAKDLSFGLTIAGQNGVIQISGPGPKHHSKYGSKGYGYGNQGYNPYQNGYGQGYNPGYGQGHGYGRQYKGHGYGRQYKGHGYGRQYKGNFNLRRARAQGYCLYPNEIRRRLRHQGWHGFKVKKIAQRIAIVKSRYQGIRYRLKVDRCTGQILKAKPKGGHGGYGPRGYY